MGLRARVVREADDAPSRGRIRHYKGTTLRCLYVTRSRLLRCLFVDRPLETLAKLTIARQIASIVLAVWRVGEVYDPTRLERASNSG
jgi:hypothetical protein